MALALTGSSDDHQFGGELDKFMEDKAIMAGSHDRSALLP